MLSVLGEGRGHMTQALGVKEIVEKAGHQVVSVAVGMAANRNPPDYFLKAIGMPVAQVRTLQFRFKNNQQVDLAGTFLGVVRSTPSYRRGVDVLKSLVKETRPDVIVNFFEALTGVYAMSCRKRPPVVAVAHQFMVGHPEYLRARGKIVQQLCMKQLVELVGAGSTRLALSLYEARDLPKKRLTVCPPILRRQLFELQPNPNGKFVLMYLLSHGYAEQIIQWHQKNPGTPLHCFYDKPGAPSEERFDETLTFHRLDGEKFLRMMADCKYVACTAGFESLSEAAYLGKPVFMVPVQNHVEQEINAMDAVRTGLGITDKSFNLDRLKELPERLDNAKYREWLSRADSIFLKTLEKAVQSK